MASKKTDKPNNLLIFLILIIVLFICFFISLTFGTKTINPLILFSNSEDINRQILISLRLPRSLLAIITGILLAGSGAVFQLFFRNELAEPGIIGISAGASLGAVIATTSGISFFSTSSFFLFKMISPINIFAFIGALFSGIIIVLLAFYKNLKGGSQNSIVLLLFGAALGTLYSSISSAILLTSKKEIRLIYSWLMGSFNGHGWNELYFILIPAIIAISLMLSIYNQLDLLGCGETSAKSLGVNIGKLQIIVLLTSAFAISAAVCAGGTISFVGLIAPHIIRKITSPKAKILIPFSMIFGAILLLVADTVARIVIAPSELPAGIITSILGVPFFVSLFLKKD